MNQMKTLTINGVSYTVADPDSVSYTAQDLTDAQKAQARENIGAIDEATLLEMTTPLLVKIDEEGMADYSASEILSYATLSGDVFLLLSGKLIPLSYVDYDKAEFVITTENTKTTYVVYDDKTTQIIEGIPGGGSVTATDDGSGNVTLVSQALTATDDGSGNVTLI